MRKCVLIQAKFISANMVHFHNVHTNKLGVKYCACAIYFSSGDSLFATIHFLSDHLSDGKVILAESV